MTFGIRQAVVALLEPLSLLVVALVLRVLVAQVSLDSALSSTRLWGLTDSSPKLAVSIAMHL